MDFKKLKSEADKLVAGIIWAKVILIGLTILIFFLISLLEK